jgi:DNA primase
MYGKAPKEQLTFQKILELISEYDIFKFYCKNFTNLNEQFSSEFRTDKNPSCIISNLDRGLIYKDFSNGEAYNCFKFVMKKFNCDFKTALSIINTDFNLNLSSNQVIKSNIDKIPEIHSDLNLTVKKSSIIKINIKNYSKKDLEYWKQYNISKEILEYFNVKSLNAYCINDSWIYSKGLCFSYKLSNKENIKRYKILNPLNKKYKWFSNTTSTCIQGINQALKSKPNFLIITSSLKDVMSLYSIGITAIAPASETVILDEEIINKLKKRISDNIIMFFDNDLAGRNFSNKYCEKYNLKEIYIEEKFNVKDPSDFIKLYGPEKLKTLLNKKINDILYT